MSGYHEREIGGLGRPDKERSDLPEKEIVPVPQDKDAVPRVEVPITPSGINRILQQEKIPKRKKEKLN